MRETIKIRLDFRTLSWQMDRQVYILFALSYWNLKNGVSLLDPLCYLNIYSRPFVKLKMTPAVNTSLICECVV